MVCEVCEAVGEARRRKDEGWRVKREVGRVEGGMGESGLSIWCLWVYGDFGGMLVCI